VTRIWRVTKWLALLCLVLVVGLVSPVAYVELACRGDGAPQPYSAVIDPAHHRAETRTLMTYPEWDIVHAYEDYAHVIATADPHDYGYLSAVGGFWSSLCTLRQEAATLGPVDGATKQMVYVIGLSFTAELLLKAAYEETIGRAATILRGPQRAPLDDVSARQAAAYAAFLQQVPWYQWNFQADAEDLRAQASDQWRDRERRFALGVEYGVKAAYADTIAQAVAQVGPDDLTLRMIVKGAGASYFNAIPEVTVMRELPGAIEIETPRYRALTHLLHRFALDGLTFVEIAGNDDILVTALSDRATEPGAIFSRARQGRSDHRHLIVLKVTDLAARLRDLSAAGMTLEHIHDY
jgi:hypothetical protein